RAQIDSPLPASWIPGTSTATLFPYTTLFRSRSRAPAGCTPARSRIRNTESGSCRPLTRQSTRRRSQADGMSPTLYFGSSSEPARAEEHTTELQSRGQLVCPPLLDKKNETAPP